MARWIDRPWTRWLGTRRLAAPFTPGSPTQPAAQPAQGEVGASDTLFGAGFLQNWRGERYTPDTLANQKGWGIYEKMLRDDQIVACLSIINAAVTGREWSFEVTDQATQGPVLEWLRFNLTQALQGTVRQLLEQLLSARVFGFALVEKIYGPMDYQGRPTWGLLGFKLRPAWTFTFQTDRHGNVQKLLQVQGDQQVELERSRFIHYVHGSEFDLQFGRSALIAAYEHWWSKSNVLKFWNIYLERMAAGFLHGKKAGPLGPAESAALERALANVQAATSIVTPDSVSLQYVTPPHTSAFSEREASMNRSIARALLMPMHLGYTDQGSTGSHAQASAQLEVFFWWLDALSTALEDVLNEQLIRELVAWNFGPVVPPRFRFEKRSPDQQQRTAKAWADAVTAGVAAQTPEDELRIRQLLGMPHKSAAPIPEPLEEGGGVVAPDAAGSGGSAAGAKGLAAESASNPLDSAQRWASVEKQTVAG